jgi:hypothetical protein
LLKGITVTNQHSPRIQPRSPAPGDTVEFLMSLPKFAWAAGDVRRPLASITARDRFQRHSRRGTGVASEAAFDR